MFDDLDSYCERITAGFGGEPLNALTGLTFLVVGLWLFYKAPKSEDRIAAAALALVGVVSASHHGWAIQATYLASWAGNLIYFIALAFLLLRRLGRLNWVTSLVAAIAVIGFLYWFVKTPLAYATLGWASDIFTIEALVFAALVVLLVRSAPATAKGIFLALILLLMGLPFRILDIPLCADFPLGIHWVWHLCNALSVAILLSALARHGLDCDRILAKPRARR